MEGGKINLGVINSQRTFNKPKLTTGGDKMKQLKLNSFLDKGTNSVNVEIVNLPAEIKNRLITSLTEWVNKNTNIIGEKWKERIIKEIRKFKSKRATIPTVAGFAMWAFCVINNLGVVSTIGVDGFAISDSTWERGFDKKTTEKLLLWVSEAVKLMQIPKEVAEQFGWG